MKTKLLLLLAAVAAVGMYGCRDVTGGGWMFSSTGEDAKATFGFNMRCYDISGGLLYDLADGHVTYHDHGLMLGDFNGAYFTGKDARKKLAFNADIKLPVGEGPLGGLYFVCDENAFYGSYVGEYTPIPPTLGEGGVVYIAAEDGGESGPDKEDTLEVWLIGGVLDGYYNAGNTQGGNITF